MLLLQFCDFLVTTVVTFARGGVGPVGRRTGSCCRAADSHALQALGGRRGVSVD